MQRIVAAFSLFVCWTASAEVNSVMELPPEIWIQESIEILSASKTEREVVIPTGTVFIENSSPERLEKPLLVIDSPKITSKSYAILGEVFHVDVEDEGYLETWNHFDQGGPYFTRTMSEFGPMRWLANTSMGFREFSLPFLLQETNLQRPTKIEMNLILPSTGRVYLRNLKLVEYTGSTEPFSSPGEWWSPSSGGKVGGLLGIMGGLLGTLIGFCGPLVAKGKAKGLCVGLLLFMALTGLIQTMLGLIALFGGQPYHVYYPLLLAGLLELVLGIVFIPVINKRYAQAEMQRMRAMDVS